MKRLEKARAECEKAKQRMEASKAKYEEDVRKLRAAEAAVMEAENMEYVRMAREMNLTLSEFALLKEQLKAGAVRPVLPEKEGHGDEKAGDGGRSEEENMEDAGGQY